MTKQEEIKGGIATLLVPVAQQAINGFDAADQILAYLASQNVVIAKFGFYSDLMEPLIESKE